MNNPYLGEVTAFGFDFAPVGWIQSAGQLLSVQQFPQLFKLLGKTFGGDGLSTFGVPNFPQMTPQGGSICLAIAGGPSRDTLPGEMTIFPYMFGPPPQWIKCTGGDLSISQYQLLFKILGTEFGGNGTTTFRTPDSHYIPPFSEPGPTVALPYEISNVSGGSSAEGFVGEIKIFPSTTPPGFKWLPCDGSLLPISRNTALYALLQTTYGGDGQTTFGLPDISLTGPVGGLQAFICQLGVFPQHP